MSERDELLMMRSIEQFRRERAQFPKEARPRRQVRIIPNDWESKYDALYRELKPSEQFGKRFKWAA